MRLANYTTFNNKCARQRGNSEKVTSKLIGGALRGKTLVLLALLAAFTLLSPDLLAQDFGGSLLDDIPLDDLVEVPAEPSFLASVVGPIALVGAGFGLALLFMWILPFQVGARYFNLYELPTGIRRGLAMSIVMYGIAFLFGALEIKYQLNMHGSAEAYFANMSHGKLIAFTHAHLFGFTTSFLIIGFPFSMQFPHLRWYQAMMPIGLAAALIDVASWWGIKYVSINFEWVSMICGILFSLTYVFMLVALLRTLVFPWVTLPSDGTAQSRQERRKLFRDRFGSD